MHFPKPPRRGRKPPKRISRRVPPHAQRRTKRAAQKRSLAYLWRVAVRKKNGGRCQLGSYFGVEATWCAGPIEAAHCFGTDEAPGVRLALWNGMPACRAHHEYFERRKRRWREVLFQMWGPSVFAERLGLARSTVKVDLEAARRELEAA